MWLQLPAALPLMVAFALPPGIPAVLCALPWVLYTGLLALVGLSRWWSHRRDSFAEWAICAGPLFVAIGGGWLLMSRLGVEPLGFREPIVLLTAAHFHHAGFVLPVLAGLAARASRSRLGPVAAVGVMVGVPLVAVGITARQLDAGLAWLDIACAGFLVIACLLTAFLQARAAMAGDEPVGRILLLASSLSLFAAMLTAAAYALGTLWDPPWIDIPTMSRTHALINALGFALLGCIGWNVRQR
jgi:hypothetical protein